MQVTISQIHPGLPGEGPVKPGGRLRDGHAAPPRATPAADAIPDDECTHYTPSPAPPDAGADTHPTGGADYFRQLSSAFCGSVATAKRFLGKAVDGVRLATDPALLQIGLDYYNFKSQAAFNHPCNRTATEDRTLKLYLDGASRTAQESLEYRELLKQRANDFMPRKVLKGARNLLTELEKVPGFDKLVRSQDKAQIEAAVISAQTHRTGRAKNEFTIQDFAVIESAVSRILIQGVAIARREAGETTPLRIAYLVPVHKESERLSQPEDEYTGEDFLRVKLEQLKFLFADCPELRWHLTLVDDEAPSADPTHQRTVDLVRTELRKAEFADIGDRVALKTYSDLSAHNPFGIQESESVKGGALQLGLRHLADPAHPESPNFVYYTDADTSVSLANTGLLLAHALRGDDVVIGSRRVDNAHVFGKPAVRQMMSAAYNMLVRTLLNVQVSDTQVGSKLIKTEALGTCLSGLSDASMSIDAQLLRLLKDTGSKTSEVGIVWIDSEILSQSANQSQSMFKSLLEIAQSRNAFFEGDIKDVSPGLKECETTLQSCREAIEKALASRSPRAEISDTWKKALATSDHRDTLFLLRKLQAHPWLRAPVEAYINALVSRGALNQMMALNGIRSARAEDKTAAGAVRDQSVVMGAGMSLMNDPKFGTVLQFSIGKVTGLVRHFDFLYEKVTPEVFHRTLHNVKKAVVSLSSGEVNGEDIRDLIRSVQELSRLPAGDIGAFLLHEFPELWDVCALLQDHPDAAKVLGPMLFGTLEPVSVATGVSYRSFSDWRSARGTPATAATKDEFLLWLRDLDRQVSGGKIAPTIPVSTTPIGRDVLVANEGRITAGRQRIEALGQQLDKQGETLQVGLMMMYDPSRTDPAYAERIISEKLAFLNELPPGGNIKASLALLNTGRSADRDEKAAPIRDLCAALLEQYGDTLKIEHLSMPTDAPAGKGSAVRFGLSELSGRLAGDAAEAGGAATASGKTPSTKVVVGFMDFSDKIDVREMNHLIADCGEAILANKPLASIGSRRMETSEVRNKPLPYILRSAGLNLVISSMFPKLWNIADTQTGFKCFSADAWKAVADQAPKCNGLGADVEWLQLAAKAGVAISENPVDFRDNLQGKFDAMDDNVSGILEDVLQIRAMHDDSHAGELRGNEVRFIGSGAENAVFAMGKDYGGLLLKIPYESLDSDFFQVLEQVVFKNRPQMSIYDQRGRVVDSSAFQTANRVFDRFIPLIRANKRLNESVMKVIAAFEKKKEKSIGYQDSANLGAGLVCPFELVRSPLELTIDGRLKQLPPDSGVKITQPAEAVFKDKLKEVFEQGCNPTEKIEAVKKLVDEGISLFERMWRRGLVDLDSNLLEDTGFVQVGNSPAKLMVLDPGECVTTVDRINVADLRAQIKLRTDYLGMMNLLGADKQLAQQAGEHFVESFQKFYNFLEADLSGPESSREFGAERRGKGPDDFKVTLGDFKLPKTTAEVQGDTKALALLHSRVGRQTPHRVKDAATGAVIPLLEKPDTRTKFFHLVPPEKPFSSLSPLSGEKRLETPLGSILPAMTHIELALNAPGSQVFLLDSGSGTRTGLIGKAVPTKGAITLGKVPLYQACVAPMVDGLAPKLPVDSVILMSGDDVMDMQQTDIDKVVSYFNLPEKPGFYFCDLPDAGRDFMPMKVQDFIGFLDNSEVASSLKEFMLQVPVLKGLAEASGAEMSVSIFRTIVREAINSGALAPGSESAQQGSPSGLTSMAAGQQVFDSLLDRYAQLLVYNAERKGGMKTPFLMVFSKPALEKFRQDVMPLIPAAAATDITWESVLIRGMKADPRIWQASKPKSIPAREWKKLREAVVKFAESQNIKFDSEAQNEKRVFAGNWHNFDDAWSLVEYCAEHYKKQPVSEWVNVISDGPSCNSIKYDKPLTVCMVGSDIKGSIQFVDDPNAPSRHYQPATSLLYGVKLPAGQKLFIPKNHMVIQHADGIFSMDMSKCTKEELKNRPVCIYDGQGKAQPHGLFRDFE